MIQTFYIVMFILSVAMTVMLLTLYKKNISVYYTLLFASIIVSDFGYMQLYAAPDFASAVYANQTVYLAACFTPFFAFMCIADLCRKKISRLFQAVCVLLGCVIFGSVMTIGTNDLYYKSISLVRAEGYSYLDKEYGPLHIVYPIYLVFMILLALGILIVSFRHKKMISYITSTMLTVIMSLTVITYIVERFLHSQLEFLPVTFGILQIGILILLNRISFYDISAISSKYMKDSMDYGFVIFMKSGRFTGADKAARTWFPELNDLNMDYVIRRNDTDLLRQICSWIGGDDTEKVCFEREGRIIEAKHWLVEGKSNGTVHCVTLRDDTQQQKYLRLMQNFNDKLEIEVNEKTDRLRHVQNDIIIGMASIVENRDNNTGGHIKRTSDIINIFVSHLMINGSFRELNPEVAECIVKAAPLHDFGKIAIPDDILNKPGKFTDEEYNEMKKHSEKGAVIVSRILQNSDDILFKNIAVNVAHYHHEKWDGSGYPSGLSEKSIPFEARIMALADVFDALVSKRVYKESLSYDKAFKIIEESCGQHFDPDLCREFLHCRPQLEKLYDSYTD